MEFQRLSAAGTCAQIRVVKENSVRAQEWPVFENIHLEQYAWVIAGLAGEHSLEEILAAEGIEEPLWRKAEVVWKTQLVEDCEASGELFAAYKQVVAEAEDRMERPVSPIDRDLGAWTRFLCAWAEHPSPFEFLKTCGLGMNDIARLSRRWTRKAEQEPAVKLRMQELAKQKNRAPLPAIDVGLPVYRPSAFARPFQTSAASLDEPSLQIQSAVGIMDLARIEELGSLPVVAVPISPVKPAPVGMPAVVRAPAALLITAPVFEAPAVFSLPFVEPAPGAPPPPAAIPSPMPVVKKAPEALGSTSLSQEIPRGPALPFSGEKGLDEIAPPVMPVVKKAPEALVSTSLSQEIPRGPVLPFSGEKGLDEIAPPVMPVVKKAPEALGSTSLSQEIPRGPVLPFSGEKAPANPVLPAPPPRPAEAPRLTLEQHASLTAEIAVAPQKLAEILIRYRLRPHQKEQLDKHYQEKLAADSALAAVWHQAYRMYGAWLMANRRE